MQKRVNVWGGGCFNSFDNGNPFTMYIYIRPSHCTLLQFYLLIIPQNKYEKKRIEKNVLAKATIHHDKTLLIFLSVPVKWDRYLCFANSIDYALIEIIFIPLKYNALITTWFGTLK